MLEQLKDKSSTTTIIVAAVGGLLALTCLVGGAIAVVLTVFGGDCPWGAELVENQEGGVLFERYCQKESDQGSFVRHGLYEEWDSDGNKLREIEYEDGDKHGVEKEWYSDGQLKRQAEYEEGELHGTVRTWFENTGNNKSEIPYHEGQRDGEARFWFEDGALRAKAKFEDGQLHGSLTGWYEPEDGSSPPKLVEVTYDQGELTRDATLHPDDDDGAKLEITFENGERTTPAAVSFGGEELSSGERALETLEGTEERGIFGFQMDECRLEIRNWYLNETEEMYDTPRCQAIADVLFEDARDALLVFGAILEHMD